MRVPGVRHLETTALGTTSADHANDLPRRDAGQRRRGRLWVGGAGLALAAVLGAGAWIWERLPGPPAEAWIDDAAAAYGRACRDLAGAARSTADALARLESTGAPRLAVFDHLHALAATSAFQGRALIYFDPDGEAVAWAGEGLLHEPAAVELPPSGLGFRRGYTSVTLFAVAPLGAGRRPSRVLVGRSFPTRGLPFLSAGRWRARDVLWSLDDPAAGAGGGGDLVRIAPDGLAPEGAPALWIDRGGGVAAASAWPARLRLAAAAALGLTLLALAFLAGAALAVKVPLVMAGLAVWALAAGLEPALAAALAASAGLALWGLLRRRAASARAGGGELAGALGLIALALAAWLLQQRFDFPNLAAELLPEPEGAAAFWAMRLTTCLAALGLLTACARSHDAEESDGAAWLAALLLLAAAAFHDLPLAALPLLAAGGGAAVRWLHRVDLPARPPRGGSGGRTRPAAFGAVLLLAALAGATAWETAWRETWRRQAATHYLPRLEPPSAEEINDLNLSIHDHFEAFELRRVMPPPAAAGRSTDPQDLAFALWRDSPLPQRDGASALIVELGDGNFSSFSFGLPLGRDLEVSRNPEDWPVPAIDAWRDAAIVGRAELLRDGRPWGVAEYWFLPRPGFRLEADEIAELEGALVRGETRQRGVDGLPRPALFGLYAADGRAIASPWDESPPLPWEVLEAARGVVTTPAGRAWYWSSPGGAAVEVVYLPRLSPREGLERVGTHALGALGALALLLVWVFALAVPPGRLRAVAGHAFYSYSKRLLVVYASLLLVPLAALNLVLLDSFEERLRREQEAEGRAALASARLLLVDYIQGLDPGFDIRTQITRELLEWISRLVRHQVNLYWGSRLYVSSQQELFTAGFLPERIPGDVFARLALLDQKVGGRTQTTGKADYLELYAPLEALGGSLGLFLSVPLLEQEEEVARELATLRRRAILLTTALVALLLAVGGRLAASFTAPIVQLIEGTRKIAAGAPFLGVAPRERELSALADAIDEMARRIAEGRQKLVLEKEVARRMVENITSGVVSLDRRRRVLMHNRVAAELLGVEVGEEIDRTIAGDERLRPVAAFVSATAADERRGTEIRTAMVELPGDAGERREWTLTWVPVPGSDDPASLLVVDDDTEVLRGQRLEAWAEMARIIAHEIKNPLTPIRLSTEHLRRVYESDRGRLDEVFERCTSNILRQVEELRDIASDFSIYSRIPRAELVDGDLVAAMREIQQAYRDGDRGGVDLEFESALGELQTRFDEKLLGRAVRNLLENALRASAAAAGNAPGEGARVVLAVERRDGQARISVLDSGPGVDADNLTRIFEPYFSTHEAGTGLGLAISQRIVEEHGGRVEAKNRPGGGLAVTITIPLAETA